MPPRRLACDGAHRRADPAALGVAPQQLTSVRRTRKADVNGQLGVRAGHAFAPGHRGLGVKSELADHRNLQALFLGTHQLGVQRALQRRRVDARMALWIRGQGDGFNPLRQHAVSQQRQGVPG